MCQIFDDTKKMFQVQKISIFKAHNFLCKGLKSIIFFTIVFFHDSKHFLNCLFILEIFFISKFSKIVQLSKPITFFEKVENQLETFFFFSVLNILRKKEISLTTTEPPLYSFMYNSNGELWICMISYFCIIVLKFSI